MIDLMRSDVTDDWGIKGLQNCILNIAKYIHDFCEANNISYCIMGGTALGAVRHGGFIPWDDDLDIFMTPDNYVKFRKCFEERGDKCNFYLQELGESQGKVVYAKLRLNNSKFIEESIKELDIHHGIFVDIMILHSCPQSVFSKINFIFWNYYLELKSLANRNYKKRGFVINCILKPLNWLPKRFLVGYALKQVWKYNKLPSNSYFHLYISQPLFRSIYPHDLFSSFEEIDFETIKLCIPVGVKDYLRILFGDYMKLPNLDYIKWHQHTNEWSANISFEKRGIGSYKDERSLW